MSDHDLAERVEWPEGVIAVRVGPGANCSSMGSSIQFMWAAAALGGVVAVVASTLIGPRKRPVAADEPKNSDKGERSDEPAST